MLNWMMNHRWSVALFVGAICAQIVATVAYMAAGNPLIIRDMETYMEHYYVWCELIPGIMLALSFIIGGIETRRLGS